jgi:hypothetical protein
MDIPHASTPIVCDMTDARDTEAERIAEYQRLFRQAILGRERTAEGIRFRFRADPGVEAWVRDLAAREKACCAFFAYEITTEGDQVLWDGAVPDNDTARAILEEFHQLPDTVLETFDDFRQRLSQQGLEVATDPGGKVHRFRQA